MVLLTAEQPPGTSKQAQTLDPPLGPPRVRCARAEHVCGLMEVAGGRCAALGATRSPGGRKAAAEPGWGGVVLAEPFGDGPGDAELLHVGAGTSLPPCWVLGWGRGGGGHTEIWGTARGAPAGMPK